jgi:hypothetical protein
MTHFIFAIIKTGGLIGEWWYLLNKVMNQLIVRMKFLQVNLPTVKMT